MGPRALDEAASQVSPGPSAGPVSQWVSDALLQVCTRGRCIAREYRLAGSAPFTGRAGGRFGVREVRSQAASAFSEWMAAIQWRVIEAARRLKDSTFYLLLYKTFKASCQRRALRVVRYVCYSP